MKVRIKAITELLPSRPMWQDYPGALPRPMPDAPVTPSRFRIEVETLDQVSAEEMARLEVGTADWADLAFPDRRRAEIPPTAGEAAIARSTEEWLVDALAVLREFEWSNRAALGFEPSICPKCERSKARGHAPNCRLDAALRGAT